MSYTNGIKDMGNKYRVQIRVGGKLLCRTFTETAYGSKEKARLEAERFVATRKSMTSKLPVTGVKNIYEKVVNSNGQDYLYLRVMKGKLNTAVCVGKIEDTREAMRLTPKYKSVLSRLSGLLVERK